MNNAIGQKSVMKGWREQFKDIFWSLKKLTMLIHDVVVVALVVRYDNLF
jgi:hypothetical protein